MKKKPDTLIIGTRAVMETILSGQPISKICLLPTTQDWSLRAKLLALAKERGIPCTKAPLAFFKRMTSKNHQGTIAFVAAVPFADLGHQVQEAYEKGRVPLVVLLDEVQDVRNMGAIARTALGMGVDALVIPRHGSALVNADAMKTSAGALNHLPLCRVASLSEAITYLQQSGLQVLACHEKAKKKITQADLCVPTALLFGGEAKGIQAIHRTMSDGAFHIPMQGVIASLNVSVAAGMALYEVVRQRSYNS
ncbi:MAG: 23S rRNA (guanosine(2251)-2'-O)-methyltransferase RlmB [Bacteroidota bacterium]